MRTLTRPGRRSSAVINVPITGLQQNRRSGSAVTNPIIHFDLSLVQIFRVLHTGRAAVIDKALRIRSRLVLVGLEPAFHAVRSALSDQRGHSLDVDGILLLGAQAVKALPLETAIAT
jgi:hypothetical protein